MLAAALLFLAISSSGSSLPPGNGKAIVRRACAGCHALKVVTSKRASKQQWSMLVNQMVSRGADLEDEEIEVVVDYLSKNFSLDKKPAGAAKPAVSSRTVNVNTATAAQLAAVLGLSSKQAASILSYREKNGNFKDWRDLAKVPGIEVQKIESKKDRLLF